MRNVAPGNSLSDVKFSPLGGTSLERVNYPG
jgi:hypothetical protein